MKPMQHQILEAVVELLHVLQKAQKMDKFLGIQPLNQASGVWFSPKKGKEQN